LFVAAAAVVVTACAELKTGTAGSEGGPPGSASNSGESSGSSGSEAPSSSGTSGKVPGENNTSNPSTGHGPGPHGALPSGYCCNDDSDCRGRHCEDLGDGKMCLDACFSGTGCQLPPDIAWTCDKNSDPSRDSFCKPTGAFTCKPASEFEYGTRLSGECCSPTGDGISGLECVGGGCVARGEGPFVCSQVCELPKDCPSSFVCMTITATRKQCVPATDTYTCK
jgi:hypothetical protein